MATSRQVCSQHGCRFIHGVRQDKWPRAHGSVRPLNRLTPFWGLPLNGSADSEALGKWVYMCRIISPPITKTINNAPNGNARLALTRPRLAKIRD